MALKTQKPKLSTKLPALSEVLFFTSLAAVSVGLFMVNFQLGMIVTGLMGALISITIGTDGEA